MKAIRFHEPGGFEKLKYEDVLEPLYKPHQVLVKVKAAALNHLDLWILKGLKSYGTEYPHIPGCDAAGEIAEVGGDVKHLKKGQRVVINPLMACGSCEYCLTGNDNICDNRKLFGASIDGGFAEYCRVDARNIIPIADTVPFDEAAAFPVTFATAWHMLMMRAKLQPGQTVLVLGAGSGVGVAAMQIAHLAGAFVIATVGSADKIVQAKSLSADAVINHSTEDIYERVMEITDQKGVDVVFEHIGPATWEKSVKSLKKNGTLVTCGATTGGEVSFDLRYVYSRQLSILGSIGGTAAETMKVNDLIGRGLLKPILDSVYPLKDAAIAFQKMESRQNFGKIILVP